MIDLNSQIDTDTTFAANSDLRIPSQKAVKTAALNWVPRLRSVFSPTYLFNSSNVEKEIKIDSNGNYQVSGANGDYFIIPIWCSGLETQIDLNWRKLTSSGIFDLYISNNGGDYNLDSSGYDGYGSSVATTTVISLTQSVAFGWNFLKLVMNGKNESSSGYYLAIYGVRLR